MKAFHEHRKYTDDLRLIAGPGIGLDFLAHWQDEIEIMIVLDGSQKMGINNRVLTLTRGDIALVAPWDIHYYAYDGSASTYMLIFPADLIAGFIIEKSCLWHVPESSCAQITEKLNQIVIELESRHFGYELTVAGILHLFLADLYRPAKNITNIEIKNDGDTGLFHMQQVLTHIEQHFRESLLRSDIALHFNLSPSHFSRLFRASTGMTYTSYLTRLRLSEACRALKQTDLTITDIAYSCGFESIRTFNRIFRQNLGCRPSDLRSS